MNVDPNLPISNFDKAINYISKGEEIGKTLMAKKQDTRMQSLLKAPRQGENLSIGKKALNLAYLGLIAAPALGSYKLTLNILKKINLAAKNDLQNDYKSLYNTKLGLETRMDELAKNNNLRIGSDKSCLGTQISQGNRLDLSTSSQEAKTKYDALYKEYTEVETKLQNKIADFEIVNKKLGFSGVGRDKEKLILKMEAIDESLNNGFIDAVGVRRKFNDEEKNALQAEKENIKNEFIADNEEAISNYTRVLTLKGSFGLKIENEQDNTLIAKTKDLTQDQITEYLEEHKAALASFRERVDKK